MASAAPDYEAIDYVETRDSAESSVGSSLRFAVRTLLTAAAISSGLIVALAAAAPEQWFSQVLGWH